MDEPKYVSDYYSYWNQSFFRLNRVKILVIFCSL